MFFSPTVELLVQALRPSDGSFQKVIAITITDSNKTSLFNLVCNIADIFYFIITRKDGVKTSDMIPMLGRQHVIKVIQYLYRKYRVSLILGI